MLMLHDMQEVPVNANPYSQVKQLKDSAEFWVHVAQLASCDEHNTQADPPAGSG